MLAVFAHDELKGILVFLQGCTQLLVLLLQCADVPEKQTFHQLAKSGVSILPYEGRNLLIKNSHYL